MKCICLVVCFLTAAGVGSVAIAQQSSDTTIINYQPVKHKIKWNYKYDQTLVLKLLLSQASFDGKYKRKDNGRSEVYLNYTEALDIIRRIDRITLQIPKIMYLVGWQYDGHDSRYPAWFQGNERLKRKEDPNSLESLKWLMKEARKYHTVISLHINMFDAYEDSPLWDEYVAHDIIAKDRNGNPLAAEWGYPISYAQEWKTGYAQRRIDSLCKILPLKQAGTIHIDAFHTWPPLPVKDENGDSKIDLSKKVTSPYLSFTVADETAAQEKIFEYWDSKGVDVTSEGVDFLRETSFEGYQPMGWWFSGLDNYKRWPSGLYTGGVDPGIWGKLFGTSMHGEDIVKKDKKQLPGFKEKFCLNTAVWYYLNRLERKYFINSASYKSVVYAGNVRTVSSGGNFFLINDRDTLVQNNDMLMPALWKGNDYLIAYSKNGYERKTWILPGQFKTAKYIAVYDVGMPGQTLLNRETVQNKSITLSLKPDQMILLKKIK